MTCQIYKWEQAQGRESGRGQTGTEGRTWVTHPQNKELAEVSEKVSWHPGQGQAAIMSFCCQIPKSAAQIPRAGLYNGGEPVSILQNRDFCPLYCPHPSEGAHPRAKGLLVLPVALGRYILSSHPAPSMT